MAQRVGRKLEAVSDFLYQKVQNGSFWKKGVFFGLTGALLGHLWARRNPFQKADYSGLTPFESQSQLKKILDDTNKPIVICFYHGMMRDTFPMRVAMEKLSKEYPDKATWMMVNYKKHYLQFTMQNLARFPDPNSTIQIRHPKRKQGIVYSTGETEVVDRYTIQPYDAGMNYTKLKTTLQKYGIVPNPDPIQELVEVATGIVLPSLKDSTS